MSGRRMSPAMWAALEMLRTNGGDWSGIRYGTLAALARRGYIAIQHLAPTWEYGPLGATNGERGRLESNFRVTVLPGACPPAADSDRATS